MEPACARTAVPDQAMTARASKRPAAIRVAIPFVFRHWLEQPVRVSTDWHATSFAGSTVRKITRGMWALDLLNDTILMALLPSLTVLVGSMILLGLHWPSLGAVIAVGSVIYVAMTMAFSVGYIAP